MKNEWMEGMSIACIVMLCIGGIYLLLGLLDVPHVLNNVVSVVVGTFTAIWVSYHHFGPKDE